VDALRVGAFGGSTVDAVLAQVRATDLFAHIANAPQRTAAAAGYDVAKVGKETVAVVTLTGVLMKSVPSMQQGTSTIEARRAIRKAADDPDVSAILLAIESPGGTVSGTFDLAADIKAAAKKKPVWAQIEDLGASAAYAAASQADKIFANNATAEVGSIGTVMAVYDLSGQAEKEGIKTLVFKTGPIKGAGIPGSVITEEQQAHFQARVDEAQKSFDAAVQKGRGLTDKQLADVKTGGVFGATEALSRKLIDGIQSMDVTISQLAAEARRVNRTQSQARAAGPVPLRSKNVTRPPRAAPAAAEPRTPSRGAFFKCRCPSSPPASSSATSASSKALPP
jgi:signal peptide peptidase SppA